MMEQAERTIPGTTGHWHYRVTRFHPRLCRAGNAARRLSDGLSPVAGSIPEAQAEIAGCSQISLPRNFVTQWYEYDCRIGRDPSRLASASS